MPGEGSFICLPPRFLGRNRLLLQNLRDSDNEMGGRQDTQNPLKAGSVPLKILAPAQTNYLWA